MYGWHCTFIKLIDNFLSDRRNAFEYQVTFSVLTQLVLVFLRVLSYVRSYSSFSLITYFLSSISACAHSFADNIYLSSSSSHNMTLL